MPYNFDFQRTGNYTQNGNPEIISCHNGLVFVLELTSHRPKEVQLVNIDNLEGDDPPPEAFGVVEDLPRNLRRELRSRGIRYQGESGGRVGLAEVM